MQTSEQEAEWTEVRSSNIARYRYDPETKVLDVQFNSGDDTYSYDDVPQDVAEGMNTAGSIGQYFYNNIRGRYRFYKG